MNVRSIAVFTANRSEFGLLAPILRAIEVHPRLKHILLVAGMHLNDALGSTRREIVAEGFEIEKYLDIGQPCEGAGELSKWVGRLTCECGEVLAGIRPDFLVVLGDRYELLAPVTAAFLGGIPIAHISGGDLTEGGLLDDTVRHTISRMAHLHFPGTEASMKRLIAMGEEPWRIRFVGEPCIDNLLSAEYPLFEEVAASIGLDPKRRYVLCTIHPVPKKDGRSDIAARETFAALAEANIQVVITYPNGDPGSSQIIAEIKRVKGTPGFVVVKSLGRIQYIPLLKHAAVVVGNSSSGIVESVPLHVPAVDLGTRQKGRPHTANVLRAPFDREKIAHKLDIALNDAAFHESVNNCISPFGEGGCGKRIADILASVRLDEKLLAKRYFFPE